jgi:hypothetical protein
LIVNVFACPGSKTTGLSFGDVEMMQPLSKDVTASMVKIDNNLFMVSSSICMIDSNSYPDVGMGMVILLISSRTSLYRI